MKLATLIAGATLLLGGVLLLERPEMAQEEIQYNPEVYREIKHDVSPPLRDLVSSGASQGEHRVIPLRHPFPLGPSSGPPDPALQTSPGPLVSTSPGVNVIGVGVGLNGFSDCCAPPDTNGAVGATQFVQWVNLSFAVFSKTNGALVKGPLAGTTFLWSGFGTQCEAHNDGDPIAQYDKAAARWVLAQPVFESPYTFCIAVSTTSDATGTYNRYAFSMPNFPDYPKLGVWPDAYYASFNMFSGGSFVGADACAFDRTKMLAGSAATAQCFQQSSSVASLLPSDLDGATAPPTGSPDFFLNFGTNSLNLWKFHVNFTTSGPPSSLTGPTIITVAAFTEACGGGTCIPQFGTKNKLDSLGDRLMYRLAYRNFPTATPAHESLVVNHSVNPGNGAASGVRWYEIRSPNATTPTIFQQGTFSPDTTSRWMGSIAMDKFGDIALGYSASSGSIYPAIYYTGRVPGDTPGTMESENRIIAGGGSQLKNFSLHRWGDYSSISVDPADDCTFWYTTEYLKSSGDFNWSTRIASFKFPLCP